MSKAINDDDNKAYEKLIKRFPLRPIKDDAQNDEAARICDSLIDRSDSLRSDERDYLEVLTDLITKYESRWDSEVSEMSPRELIQYLIDQNELAQKDLVPEFGSPSRVSEFLKGERRLSLEQAKKLAERFRLNIASLIDEKHDSPRSRKLPTAATPLFCETERIGLKHLLTQMQPVSYKLFFEAFTHLAEDRGNATMSFAGGDGGDTFVLQLLQRPIEENDLSRIYCNIFNAINLWVIAAKTSKSTTSNMSVAEGVDIDLYMTFLRPEYMAWENAIRKGPRHNHWLHRHNITTNGEFLHNLHTLAERHWQARPNFWGRYVNPKEGQPAFERFAIDLYEELGEMIRAE